MSVANSLAKAFPDLAIARRGVGIDSAPRRPEVVVGVLVGRDDAPLNVATKAVLAAASWCRRECARVLGDTSRLSDERLSGIEMIANSAVRKVTEALAPAVAALDDICTESRTAQWSYAAPWTSASSFASVQTDLEAARTLRAMPIHERQTIVERIVADAPTADAITWITSMLRCPRELVGISKQDRDRVRVASLVGFERNRAESLADGEAQGRLLQEAVRAVITAIGVEHMPARVALAEDPLVKAILGREVPNGFTRAIASQGERQQRALVA